MTLPWEQLKAFRIVDARMNDMEHVMNARIILGTSLPAYTDGQYIMSRTYNPAYRDLLYLYAAYPATPGTRADPQISAVFRSPEDREVYIDEVTGNKDGSNPLEDSDYGRWTDRHVVVASEEDWCRLVTCATLKLKYNDHHVIKVRPFAHYDEELHHMMLEDNSKESS